MVLVLRRPCVGDRRILEKCRATLWLELLVLLMTDFSDDVQILAESLECFSSPHYLLGLLGRFILQIYRWQIARLLNITQKQIRSLLMVSVLAQ